MRRRCRAATTPEGLRPRARTGFSGALDAPRFHQHVSEVCLSQPVGMMNEPYFTTQVETPACILLSHCGLPSPQYTLLVAARSLWLRIDPLLMAFERFENLTCLSSLQEACAAIGRRAPWLLTAGRSLLRAWLYWHPLLGPNKNAAAA